MFLKEDLIEYVVTDTWKCRYAGKDRGCNTDSRFFAASTIAWPAYQL
jgi:hypothetical protein